MKRYINIILLILWMIFIFMMSSYNSVESSNQSNFIVDIITNIFNIDNTKYISLIVRKMAHFTEYFILGILTYNVIKNYHISIIICILYAISDEFHQLFIDGRSCQLLDILIDSLGSIISIYIRKITS